MDVEIAAMASVSTVGSERFAGVAEVILVIGEVNQRVVWMCEMKFGGVALLDRSHYSNSLIMFWWFRICRELRKTIWQFKRD